MPLYNESKWYGLFVNGFLYQVERFNHSPSLLDFNVPILHGSEYEILEVFIEF